MICPPGKTSIRKRPPLMSATSLASRWAAPWMVMAWVQLVDMRHWTLGWAMTLGLSRTVAAATAPMALVAVRRNLRRSDIRPPALRGLEGLGGGSGGTDEDDGTAAYRTRRRSDARDSPPR